MTDRILRGGGGRRRIVICCLFAFPLRAESGPCLAHPGDYERDGYHVRQVRIDAPLAWLGPVKRHLESVVAGMPLKPRRHDSAGNVIHPGTFTVAEFNAGVEEVQRGLGELRVDRTMRVALEFGWPALENCDSGEKMLDAVYHVYTFQFSPNLLRTFRTGNEVGRAPPDTGLTRALAAIDPQPYVGYNRSRNVFGGTRLRLRNPVPPFRTAELEASGSSTSLWLKASLTGVHEFGPRLIQRAEWGFGYIHSDMPAQDLRLREGSLRAQFFASTRAATAAELVVRTGVSLEGGNKQTDLASSPPGRFDPPSSGFGALKVYAGQSMRAGPFVLRNSYGVQFGKAADSLRIGYRKHLVDSAHSARFLIGDHRVIALDTRFNAGFLNAGQGAPVAERFFGGNVVREFISGDRWSIAADPMIRSFPQNRLAVTAAGPFGGDRFFSAGATVAFTGWRFPLTPSEVLESDGFMDAVDLQLAMAETTLGNEYRSSSAEAVSLARRAGSAFDPGLKGMSGALENAKAALAPSAATELQKCEASLKKTSARLDMIRTKLKDDAADLTSIRTIAALTGTAPPRLAYLTEVRQTCGALEPLLAPTRPEVQSAISTARTELEVAQSSVRDEFNALEQSPGAKRLLKKAEDDMRYPRRVVNELLREVNLAAISPVWVFDAARVWQSGVSGGDVRCATGPGIRFSLVNLDLTVGYAFTVGRKPGEGRGALLATFGVSNLFR